MGDLIMRGRLVARQYDQAEVVWFGVYLCLLGVEKGRTNGFGSIKPRSHTAVPAIVAVGFSFGRGKGRRRPKPWQSRSMT